MSDEAPPRLPRRSWICPVCRQRLWSRPTHEEKDAFEARCEAHQRAGRVCAARVLIKKLKADGFIPLRRNGLNDFTLEYLGLNDAGLVEWHPTHIIGDSYVRGTPWGPRWAARYDQYMRRARKASLHSRVAELREAAATPRSIELLLAFLAFAHTDEVDLGGQP